MIHANYKSHSTLAIVSTLLSLMGLFTFVVIPFVMATIVAVVCLVIADRQIRFYDLDGDRFVAASIFLSATTFTLAPIWHLHLYRSESLPNHLRVNFAEAINAELKTLDQYENAAICLKGYALPTRESSMRTFQFSADGNSRKQEDAITVSLPFEWDYEYAAISVSGTLRVNRQAKQNTKRYEFDAVKVHKTNTSYGLARRSPGRGC